ncbi:hypothetical protein JHL17_04780 [Azospirillum sp. YIM B02556]|uniref:Uncharacterized protein n=1 Tax=Azospirillum endophyticum TaxID=2800326 RepID=A0ABS1EZX9_9PROT|nr:hypothetical protein [Azospirillum endophyticum]MBK1836720.1 hypothetical protein [Azospirillum endophyticum]
MDHDLGNPVLRPFAAVAALWPRLRHPFKLRLPDRQSPGYYEDMLKLDPGAGSESLMKIL